MCGLGLVLRKKSELKVDLIKAGELIAHRGPDGKGMLKLDNQLQKTDNDHWLIGAVHRRLSIIDISDDGLQPMSYNDERLWVVFNGEIYNYLELRTELLAKGYQFHTKTDTEVILASYYEWGTDCFAKFRGMWAIVLVDKSSGEIVISRDRFGIKPLYIINNKDLIFFFSELKQLAAVPSVKRSVNINALREFVFTGYEDPEASFFDGIQTSKAGCFSVYSINEANLLREESFWNPENIEPDILNVEEFNKEFFNLFDQSIRYHIRSDVPLGCALSGGLDSSAIVASTSKHFAISDSKLNTFSVDFKNFEKSEKFFVESVINMIGVNHNYIFPDSNQFTDDFDQFTYQHDEPVGSMSVYVSYCLSKLVRDSNIKVLLNGQGGDEILGGYWQIYLSYLMDSIKKGRIGFVTGQLVRSLGWSGNPGIIGVFPKYFYRFFRKKEYPKNFFKQEATNDKDQSILRQYIDADEKGRRILELRKLFLPKYLKWDDRNSMSHSIEGRYPFLDHKLVELTLRARKDFFYKNGWTKMPLRKTFEGLLPKEVLYRKDKIGFETPQTKWLNGPLRPFALALFSKSNPVWDVLEYKEVCGYFEKYISNSANLTDERSFMLFRIISLNRWLKKTNVQTR